MSPPRINGRAGIRELWGLALLTISVLMVLAAVSYRSGDISLLRMPPNDPPLNYIGPAGAWFIFVSLMVFGAAALFLPIFCFGLGLLLLLRPDEPVRPWALWGAAAIAASSALLTIHSSGWETLCARFNITGFSGGLAGWLLADQFLSALFGSAGATVILSALLVTALVMGVGLARLRTLAGRAVGMCLLMRAQIKTALDARRSRLEKITVEEREIAKKRAALEKAMRREKAIADVAPVRDEPSPAAAVESRATAAAPAPAPPPQTEKRGKPRPAVDSQPAAAASPPCPPPADQAYQLPPLSLLHPLPTDKERRMQDDPATTAKVLIETLAEFGIESEIKHVEQGPVVTRYELLPAAGVRVERIGQLTNNLALTLKATSVRVQAPIPGKGVVGIEVPNSSATRVYLREILEGETWRNSRAEIPIVLGKDVGGKDVIPDLAAMPHLLIAGATGSGKTVCMNSILAGLLMSRTPAQLRLMLIDPKLVEFAAYNDLPHLIVPVITDPKKVVFGLRWAINEMEKRYKLFARSGVRNIQGYNSRPIAQEMLPPLGAEEAAEKMPERLPYIVIVIDELADLMMVAQADVENHIARLAQLSRAVGIHMILATQRPSVNIITGTIKANFPARLSFQVAQKVDSRTILDTTGADKLLGRGDMLFLQPVSSKLTRAQGALTGDDDIHAIVNFIKERSQPNYELAIKQHLEKAEGVDFSGDDSIDEDLLEAAVQIIRETRRASVSLLQRRLKIGYNRAGRLMDRLEEKGFVGPVHGSDPREILIDLDAQNTSNVQEQQGEI
ncbi:MAG: DNA translocase FtsK [Kiritimatiellae bacterium]|nr:DNA translocase FtsK [Kiritimatiellia bacterium]